MIELPKIRPLIEKLSTESRAISSNEDLYRVPSELKQQFGNAWGKEFKVKDDYIKLRTSKSGEVVRNSEVFDWLLIKCAHAVELYEAYNSYLNQAKIVKDLGPNPLTKDDWKLLGEDREQPLDSELKQRIDSRIDSLVDLSVESRKLLRSFMTSEKDDREQELGNYKGLSRTDPFFPVAATAFDLRVDYYAYISDVILLLLQNKDVTNRLLAISPTQGNSANMKQLIDLNIRDPFITICDFAKEYNLAAGAWLTSDLKCLAARANLIKIEQWLRSQFEVFQGVPIQFKFGRGSGNFPKIPWLCLLPPGQTANNGIYVSICFGKEGAGAVCGFAGSAETPQRLTYADLGDNPAIDVDTFNHGFVNPENFFKDSFDEEKLRNHISESLTLCLDQLKLLTTSMFTNADKTKLTDAVKATGFQAEAVLVARVIASLAAKSFLILTGNSGTGKTKLAELVAARLSGKNAHVTVAVGAGWTDNRNVVGFVNFLRSDSARKEGADVSPQLPLYQSTPILDLLLRADKNPAEPHFLILDEMNLSHVERYFADFLSAMESTKGLIHLHSEGDEETMLAVVSGGGPAVPRRLAFPSNVFVIGTVNVDETTYMFSPKVLDRSNVIEFRTGMTQIGEYLTSSKAGVSEITPGSDSEQRGFLQLAKAVRSGTVEAGDADTSRSIGEALTKVFDIMADARLEFGFRTIKEVVAYHAADFALSADASKWKWETVFDFQLLQKVLPKLHGSKRRLEPLLLRLASFCETGAIPAKDAAYPDDLSVSGGVKYSLSRAKLVEMIEAVRRDQFVSFIH
jgi:5-methylcytosine-specific restriction protein B